MVYPSESRLLIELIQDLVNCKQKLNKGCSNGEQLISRMRDGEAFVTPEVRYGKLQSFP